jgi:hypothetical protein
VLALNLSGLLMVNIDSSPPAPSKKSFRGHKMEKLFEYLINIVNLIKLLIPRKMPVAARFLLLGLLLGIFITPAYFLLFLMILNTPQTLW